MTLAELLTLDEKTVVELFYPPVIREPTKELPDFAALYKQMQATGSRLTVWALWKRYKQEHEEGYEYTQFSKRFKDWMLENVGTKDLRMVINRKPGEKMFVDWVGDQPELLIDSETGELHPVHIFCSTIGVSSLAYIEAFANEQKVNYGRGIVHALEYYGAVPKILTCDNLKTGVIMHTRDIVRLTDLSKELEDYYGFIIVPAPPYKPRAKPTVENLVRTTEQTWTEELKARGPFTSLEELNRMGRELLEELNNRVSGSRKESRRAIFEEYDRPQMGSPPAESFSVYDDSMRKKVPTTYHVSFDGHDYSVPYMLVGKTVVVKAFGEKITITDTQNHLVTSHKRAYDKYPVHITKPEHCPPAHVYRRLIDGMDGDYWRNWADTIGPATREVLDRILGSTEHEERMYENYARVYMKIRKIAPEVLEAAAQQCIEQDACLPTQYEECVLGMAKQQLSETINEADRVSQSMQSQSKGAPCKADARSQNTPRQLKEASCKADARSHNVRRQPQTETTHKTSTMLQSTRGKDYYK